MKLFYQSLSSLSGVGPRINNLLHEMGLEHLLDVLFHLPIRYQDRTRITPIAQLQQGSQVLIEGEICSATITPGKRPNLLCCLQDDTGMIHLRFFHFTASQKQQLSRGGHYRCFGEVRSAFRQYGFEMIHPEYRPSEKGSLLGLEKTLTPLYPTVQGVNQSLLRRLTDHALKMAAECAHELELIPHALLDKIQYPELLQALFFVHRPPVDAPVDLLLNRQHPMQKRLAFEELVAHQISLQRTRLQARSIKAQALTATSDLKAEFLKNLGFALTNAQVRVLNEIAADLSLNYPMMRLLQGDVGSGKTVIAAMVMLHAVANDVQAALIAPTELLAEQHYENLRRWFEPLAISIGYLGGKQSSSIKTQMLHQIATGQCQIIIGTHALFQNKVQYHRLSLVVIDEQHRFGVGQRLSLRQKGDKLGYQPHQLLMSATPIPRTLAMTAYADLAVSTLDELPPGRQVVHTALISSKKRQHVIERVRAVCLQKRQVYWVCTLINESEALQCQAAENTLQELQNDLPELKMSLVHSRLSPDIKLATMKAFKNGEIDILVATTVIEVGVDVPNASLMIIENPERLGLSQLHQLRGRVGRGSLQSFCVLLYQEPLSVLARQRLQVLKNIQDGFQIAQEDLKIRGPGEVLGTRQSGILKFRIADLLRDQNLLPQVQFVSTKLITDLPEKADALVDRWIHQGQKYIFA
ncbi:MAG: ATP-dependent DNA helicase RecG [Proteobacteria bacterium]|nr:ATP-dependent DNA helicase RecG [Pseudomonadota bacterium]